jgi:hypothetical protein
MSYRSNNMEKKSMYSRTRENSSCKSAAKLLSGWIGGPDDQRYGLKKGAGISTVVNFDYHIYGSIGAEEKRNI